MADLDRIKWLMFWTLVLFVGDVHCQNVTATAAFWEGEFPKIFFSAILIIVCLLLGWLIAKCADYIYHRKDIPDNVSDISENTRELLTKQIMLLSSSMNAKVESHKTETDKARTAAKTWLNRSRRKSKQMDAESGGIINVAATNDDGQVASSSSVEPIPHETNDTKVDDNHKKASDDNPKKTKTTTKKKKVLKTPKISVEGPDGPPVNT